MFPRNVLDHRRLRDNSNDLSGEMSLSLTASENVFNGNSGRQNDRKQTWKQPGTDPSMILFVSTTMNGKNEAAKHDKSHEYFDFVNSTIGLKVFLSPNLSRNEQRKKSRRSEDYLSSILDVGRAAIWESGKNNHRCKDTSVLISLK
jgi:hypothetical protein